MKSQNNIGRFKVHNRFFADLSTDEGVNLFHGMVVLECRIDWLGDHREYVAIHPAFRAVPVGELIPEYNATFRYDRGATSLPEWHEIPPVKGLDRETLTRLVSRNLAASIIDGNRQAANSNTAGTGKREQHVKRGRLTDIKRVGWWVRLHRKLRELVRLHLHPQLRDPSTGRFVSAGGQRKLVGTVGTFQPRSEHDPHGDGLPGQGLGHDARHRAAADAPAANRADSSARGSPSAFHAAESKRWEDVFPQDFGRQAYKGGGGQVRGSDEDGPHFGV